MKIFTVSIAAIIFSIAGPLSAQSNPNTTLTGYIQAIADFNQSSPVIDNIDSPNGTVQAEDFYGIARSQATTSLFGPSGRIHLDFNSKVSVVSSANTQPIATATFSLRFTIATPAHLSLTGSTFASDNNSGYAISRLLLNDANSGALIASAGSNLSGYSSNKIQFDDWIPAGSYVFQTEASASLNRGGPFGQTDTMSGYEGTFSLSQVPEPSTYLFGGATLLIALYRSSRKSRRV